MDILKLGTDLISQRLGLQLDPADVSAALSKLLGDGQGNIDLAGLVASMSANGGLASVVNSWLGDGANAGISADAIADLLGSDRVAAFASSVGTSSGDAAAGLADVLPQLMDKASSGGSLLAGGDGLGSLLGAAKSFLS